MFTYETNGVCSKKITFDIEDKVLKNVKFYSGCTGNLIALSKLVENMPAGQAIELLKGISCGDKGTSCPDQLAKAIEQALEPEKSTEL